MKRGTVVALRLRQSVDADGAAAASNAIHDGQARRLMLVKFPARVFHRFIHATARRRGAHDFVNAHVRREAVISRHAATDVAFGHDADDLAVLRVLDHRRAATA